jgi:hypothetical protein
MFFIAGPAGSLQVLRDMGYRVFDDILDNSYDTSVSSTMRWELLRDAIKQAQEQITNNGIALGSLENRQFAWSANKDMVLNSFCDSCVFVDNTKLFGLRYRTYVEGKEDRDFAMQVIKLGQKTGRTTLYAFSAPANGSNAGGLKEIFYDLGKEKVCVQRMIELWGENICIPITKENGRNDIKIMWNNINTNQITLF